MVPHIRLKPCHAMQCLDRVPPTLVVPGMASSRGCSAAHPCLAEGTRLTLRDANSGRVRRS